jgi:tetratricopeptide (TPR) repeat protein
VLSTALSFTGNPTEALKLLDQDVARRPEDPVAGRNTLGFSPWISAVMFRNWPLAILGRFDELGQALRRAIELAREHEALEILSWGLGLRAAYGDWIGEATNAVASARQGAEIAERVGHPFFLSVVLSWLGNALRLEQRHEEALEVYEKTLGLMDTKRVAIQWRPVVFSGQALANSKLGKHDKAIAQARSALDESLTEGNRYGEGVARLTLARVLLATGDPELHDEIEETVERAEALCEQTAMRVNLPSLLEVRAALAERQGDPQDARRTLREAHRLYTEMGATGHAMRLARELGP